MARIVLTVTPKNGDDIGWDVYCVRWKADEKSLTIHKLAWTGPVDGDFTGTSADLPQGTYGIFAAATLSGGKVSVEVEGRPPVLQPAGSNWPMVVKLTDSTTQAADTWYFSH